MARLSVTFLSLIALVWLVSPLAAAEPDRPTSFPGEKLYTAAFKKAREEGRLMLCVCSGAGDKKMQRFMNRLKEDPKLRRLAEQYVVVFVDADFQTPTVNRFNQTGKVQGEPPWVFIVVPVPGGKVIGAAADLSESDKIPEFLLSGLATAGMALSPKEGAKYATSLTKAKEMMADDNPAQALTLLVPAMRARGFSDSVAESRELWQEIAKKASDELTECEKLTADASQNFPAALMVTEIGRKYLKIPDQKKATEQLAAKIGKLPDGHAMLTQAQEIIKARGLVRAGKPEGGVTIYQRLIDKHPGSPAAELAKKEIQAIAQMPAATKDAREKNR